MHLEYTNHDQKIVYARASLWAPFYAVGMAARIQGNLPVELVKGALRKLRILYPPLASRVRVEDSGAAWLTTEGVGEFPLEVYPRTSDDDWAKIFLEQEKVPFAFGSGPVARFCLLRDDRVSDLVAIAPHVVCDGYSLAHVMWQAVALMNDPGRLVAPPSASPAVDWQTVPDSARTNLHLRGIVQLVNFAWPDHRVVLHQDGYEELHRRYWTRQQNGMLAFSLSPSKTASLAARCRSHGVAVTGALVAAFLLAQAAVQPARQTARSEISVSINIRDRITPNPGLAVGVYASSIDLALPLKSDTSFWELAREVHTRLHKSLGNRAQVYKPMVLNDLDPSLADTLIAAVAAEKPGLEVGIFTRFFKIKGEARSLNMSNIGRLDLPDAGASYPLENLMTLPPLVPGGGMALSVLTLNGQMHIVMKFQQDRLDAGAAAGIRDRALDYLSAA